MVALSRFKLWWMRPSHIAHPSAVPPETQLLLGETPEALPDGGTLYTVFIPLLDGVVKCSLKGAADQTLHVVAETGCPGTPVPAYVHALYIAVGADPFVLLEASMAAGEVELTVSVGSDAGADFEGLSSHPGASAAVSTPASSGGEGGEWAVNGGAGGAHLGGGRRRSVEQGVPSFVNHFGWCTWDSW
ncbi:hypothetical protein JKP88DRAFT_178307 [Tribonema minus]|uniref:Uncharacterized protein n=1 Tax=Tribonema minus TaxID=303371 RepID=A0A835Z7Z4_9STRA|nr:hypothetical protein JKP88DRAFT_178307 [Tribonema minus]